MSARSFVTLRPSASRDSYDARGSAAPFTAYEAPGWLPGGQLQTIYAYYLKQTPNFMYRRQHWETPDGDFIDLDWLDASSEESRLLVMFHGLEGCSRSHYAVSLMNQLRGEGWCGVVPHFRGCGGEINRLPRGYHAGDSAEVDWILRRLKEEKLRDRLHVVGIFMGGNDLLKWLGQQGDHALDVVRRAVAVSAPLDLQTAAKQLDHGWNKLIYTQDFLRTMKPKVLEKVAAHGLDLNPRAIRVTSTFREIDNLYTAPIHGFRDADELLDSLEQQALASAHQSPDPSDQRAQRSFFPGARAANARRSRRSRDPRVPRVRWPFGLCVGKISRTP
jgi:uncharacterized protein